MAGEQRGRELDDQVRQWLQQQDPPVKFIESNSDPNASNWDPLSPDFMVLSPFPLAIITILTLSAATLAKKSKRLLAQRISIAERFGSFMPVAVVVPGELPLVSATFADVILPLDVLPDFQTLWAKIKLNPDFQKIANDGEPSDVIFSNDSDISKRWCHTVTLEDLACQSEAFPDDSLANRLQEVLVPIRKAVIEQPPEITNRRPGRFSNSMAECPSYRNPNWWSRSACWSDSFDEVLFRFVEERCGGSLETKSHREPQYRGGVIRNHVWKSPDGIEVVVRRQSFDDVSVSHKVRELVAEAWMTRAFMKSDIHAQLLLAGKTGSDLRVTNTISGELNDNTKAPHLGIQHINALEAAGWLVAPWDFSEKEPNFITHLKEVGDV